MPGRPHKSLKPYNHNEKKNTHLNITSHMYKSLYPLYRILNNVKKQTNSNSFLFTCVSNLKTTEKHLKFSISVTVSVQS